MVRIPTKFALVLVGWSFLPSEGTTARPPSGAPTVCRGTVCQPSNGIPKKTLWRPQPRVGEVVHCSNAYVVDGDTLRCGRERIRLLGIDAPEIEACPRWRTCVAGDGQESKRSLAATLSFGEVTYQPITHDRFGRTVAIVWAGSQNLSCWQLQQGQAVYKGNWDNGGVVSRDCR